MGESRSQNDHVLSYLLVVFPGDGPPPPGPCRRGASVARQGRPTDERGNAKRKHCVEPPRHVAALPSRGGGAVEEIVGIQRKAAGEVLTAKQAPHRPGISPADGLRADGDDVRIVSQTSLRKEECHVVPESAA